MRPPRMTTRRWMIAVAVVGVAMGGTAFAIRMAQLSDRYRQAASAFRTAESMVRLNDLEVRHRFPKAGEALRKPLSRREDPRRRAMAEQLGRQAEKFERAARYPWLSVESDPLPPGP